MMIACLGFAGECFFWPGGGSSCREGGETADEKEEPYKDTNTVPANDAYTNTELDLGRKTYSQS